MKKRKFKKWLVLLILSRFAFFLYITVGCTALFFLVYYGYKETYGNKYVYLSPLPLSSKIASTTGKLQDASTLTQLLKDAKIKTQEITTRADYYKLILLSGEEVYFSKKIDLETQVASLQLIISRLTIEAKGFVKLDFRYEKPVMVLK